MRLKVLYGNNLPFELIWTENSCLFQLLSHQYNIPRARMKVIHRGRKIRSNQVNAPNRNYSLDKYVRYDKQQAREIIRDGSIIMLFGTPTGKRSISRDVCLNREMRSYVIQAVRNLCSSAAAFCGAVQLLILSFLCPGRARNNMTISYQNNITEQDNNQDMSCFSTVIFVHRMQNQTKRLSLFERLRLRIIMKINYV